MLVINVVADDIYNNFVPNKNCRKTRISGDIYFFFKCFLKKSYVIYFLNEKI